MACGLWPLLFLGVFLLELALILIVFVVIDLVMTFFLLGRLREFLRRLKVLEIEYESVPATEPDSQAARAVETPEIDVSQLVANATPEDIAQAAAILEKLGIKA